LLLELLPGLRGLGEAGLLQQILPVVFGEMVGELKEASKPRPRGRPRKSDKDN
jgi:hypothetical protein